MTELINRINEKISGIEDIVKKLSDNSVTLNRLEQEELPYIKEKLEKIKKWLNEVKSDISIYGQSGSFEKVTNNVLNQLNLYGVLGKVEINGSGAFYTKVTHPNNFRILNTALSAIGSYQTIKEFAFGGENTVLVGANGSGKSTLASQLQEIIQKDSGIVIMAQRTLLIPNIENLPTLSAATQRYREFDKRVPDLKKKFSVLTLSPGSIPSNFWLGSELLYLIGFLLAEKIGGYLQYDDRRRAKGDGGVPDESLLTTTIDKTFSIWNDLFNPLRLTLSKEGAIEVSNDLTVNSFEGNSLSDGEKDALYLIGRVLLAPTDSLIVVDEPEIHLHKSIVTALWDRLEKERKDCTFFYFTHDIDFAVSRNARKLWLKEFAPPSKWVTMGISESTIPEDLYLKLLGSKRRILFCEGKKGGLDHLLYSVLFPEFLVEPVNNCSNVKNYVRAFNSGDFTNIQAFGIIDKDLLEEEDISDLAADNIYVLALPEVENVFLLKELLEPFARYKKEDVDFEKLEMNVLEEIRDKKEEMISQSISLYAQRIFSKNTFERKDDLDDIKASLEKRKVEGLKILEEKILGLRGQLESALEKNDYSQAIRVAFHKGLIVNIKNVFNESDKKIFRNKLLNFLRNNPEVSVLITEKIGLRNLLLNDKSIN